MTVLSIYIYRALLIIGVGKSISDTFKMSLLNHRRSTPAIQCWRFSKPLECFSRVTIKAALNVLMLKLMANSYWLILDLLITGGFISASSWTFYFFDNYNESNIIFSFSRMYIYISLWLVLFLLGRIQESMREFESLSSRPDVNLSSTLGLIQGHRKAKVIGRMLCLFAASDFCFLVLACFVIIYLS